MCGSMPSSYLESLVCVKVEREAGVWEEEMQAAEVEQVIAAHLLRKRLDCARVTDRIQKAHLCSISRGESLSQEI